MAIIKSSRYVGPIKNQVEDWDRRLTLFSKTLDEWIVCQKRFWRDLMRKTDDKPNALRAATTPGLFESLQSYGKDTTIP